MKEETSEKKPLSESSVPYKGTSANPGSLPRWLKIGSAVALIAVACVIAAHMTHLY